MGTSLQKQLQRTVRTGGPESFDPVLALRWADFNESLMKLSEKQVEAMLARERAKRKRLHVMLRIQSRLSKLRRDRERREIVESAS